MLQISDGYGISIKLRQRNLRSLGPFRPNEMYQIARKVNASPVFRCLEGKDENVISAGPLIVFFESTGYKVKLKDIYVSVRRRETASAYGDAILEYMSYYPSQDFNFHCVNRRQNREHLIIRGDTGDHYRLFENFYVYDNRDELEFASRKIVEEFVDFCVSSLESHGYLQIYLLGSRATGVSSKGGMVRDNSDHDFMVVIDDSASSDLCTGGNAWSKWYGTVVKRFGFNVDCFIMRNSEFQKYRIDPTTPAGKAARGIIISSFSQF